MFLSLRILPLALLLLTAAGLAQGSEIEAITFAADPGQIYVAAEDAAAKLRWRTSDSSIQLLTRLNGNSINSRNFRNINGTAWVTLTTLASCGAIVTPDPQHSRYHVQSRRRSFTTSIGAKRIHVDLARQRLHAYQGYQLVLDTNISSGRTGNTPSGYFTAGPYKSRMHYSSKYHNAPMPWSVQITGHIFFHGFSSVPSYPASHGCIRVPLTGANPARFLYEWVDVGTPIQIARGQKEEIRRALPAS